MFSRSIWPIGLVSLRLGHYSSSDLALKSSQIKTEKLRKIAINPELGKPVEPAGS